VKLIGVDLGEKRVGLAVFDDPELPARPLDTVEVTPDTAVKRVAARVLAERATQLVVGLPLRLDGREGGAARNARRFAHALAKATRLPVDLQDERLTTAQAHGHRIAAGQKSRAGIDARAAAILLETWAISKGLTCRRLQDPDHDESE
jgi:putative Holliday junction resolvase